MSIVTINTPYGVTGAGSGGDSMAYVVGEVNTGDTWIDGKPIYRTVVSGTRGSVAARAQQNLTIATGADFIIAAGGWVILRAPSMKVLVGTSMIESISVGTTASAVNRYWSMLERNTSYNIVSSWCTADAITDMQYQIWAEYTKL